jgi:hypothetical protein
MSVSLRILSLAAFLIADVTLPTSTAKAADIAHATSAVHWRARNHYRWAAPIVLVAGVRGATPLTVPFFGSNWYPGPAYYHGPGRSSCMCGREDAVISVRY